MTDDTVYVDTEGRPWRKTEGGFDRLPAPTVEDVTPDRVVIINGHRFIKAPPGSKRKP